MLHLFAMLPLFSKNGKIFPTPVTPREKDALPEWNWRLSFENKNVQRKYELYAKNTTSVRGLLVFLISVLLAAILYTFYALSRPMNETYYAAYVVICVAADLSFLPGFFLVYLLLYPRTFLGRNIKATTIGNIFILMLICSINCYMVLRMISGQCEISGDPFGQLACNPEHDAHALPQDAALASILFLAILQVLVKCHNFSSMIIAWFITFSTILCCIVVYGAYTSFILPVFTLLVFCLLYEYESNSMRTYIAMQGQEQSLRATIRVEIEKHDVEQRAEEMKHLLGNVAHDLKTPMQGFVVGLENLSLVLKKCLNGTAQTVTYSRMQIDDSTKTLQSLNDTCRFMFMTINRALDFSKAAAGIQLVPNLETVQIEEAAKWAIECVNNVKEKVRVIFEPVPASICKHVITDKMWLVENLLCLISNAVKFTTEGEVVVRCLLRDGKLRFEVEDDGIGISKSKRAELFRPYRQAQRFVGGTGLGLFSLSKRVEALRGSCGVDDRDDSKAGSRFWFEIEYRPDEVTLQSTKNMELRPSLLPRQSFMTTKYDERIAIFHSESHESAPDTIAISDNNSSSTNYPDSVSVLLVEDSLMVQKVTGKALRNVGWTVEVADNGDIGLRMMKEKKYAVVLMDLQMPVMDGLESVRRLRQYEMDTGVAACDRQVIIGVSANSDSAAEASSMSVGMDGFIPKPFTVRQLVDFCVKNGISL